MHVLCTVYGRRLSLFCKNEYCMSHTSLLRCHQRCFTNLFNLCVHLSAPLQSYFHVLTPTHSLFFPPSVMRYKDHTREPLCAPSSLISACSVSTWVKLVAGSKEIFSETGLMPETLCGGSVFKFYHSSPIRSYIYYSWQAREVKRDWKRWKTLKLNFLLWINQQI